MLRYEIKEFILDIGGESHRAAVPFTLYSAMNEMGLAKKEDTLAKSNVEKMRADAVFTVDEELYSIKYTYIRLFGAHSPCEIFLNGLSVGKTEAGCDRLLFNLGDAVKKGENTLSFEFSAPDWDVGIFSAIELLRFNNSIIDGVRISEVREGGSVSLNVEITAIGNAERTRGVATLISGSGQIYYGGFSDGAATVHISDPLFWHPLGLGVQNIYKLTVNLYGDAEAEDSLEFRVGLRDVKSTDSAVLSINGVDLLPMGAVYVPETVYLPGESRRRTAAFITSAAMSGFNTFVIRGDRLPQDAFFDLCDVHGIAVICEINNLETSELKSIAAVAHHPSFIHLDVIGVNDKKSAEAKIREFIKGIDISFADFAENYFGEASIPSDRVTCSKILPEDRNVFSEEMEKQSGGMCRSMAASVGEKYLYALSFSDFAYLTRLAQAENTKSEMLARRQAMGNDGRAVFAEMSTNRLVSASSLDLDAGWKALQYYARGFFAPVTVTAKAEGASVSFTAVNNKNVAVFGVLEYRVIDNENKILYKYSEEIDIAENSVKAVFTHDLSKYISSADKERFVEYTFTEGSKILANGVVLFTLPKYFKYKNPNIKAEIEGGDRHFSITLSAENYAGCVELCFAETDAVFSDNYFDITSEIPVKITLTAASPVETAKSLKKQLKIRSLYDIGKI